jgi:hypothetical protein
VGGFAEQGTKRRCARSGRRPLYCVEFGFFPTIALVRRPGRPQGDESSRPVVDGHDRPLSALKFVTGGNHLSRRFLIPTTVSRYDLVYPIAEENHGA